MRPDPNVLLRTEPCAECGGMMLWTQNVWAHGDNRAAAYQCPKGHVLDPDTTRQCPRCGSHDTAAAPESRVCECSRCGNQFEISVSV
jgi:DNA-directed RNA polymerase subunit M/transcription elongation factor TFIIS